MKKHLVFIINPRSGTDRVKAMQAAIEAGIDPEQYTTDIRYTEYAQHGTELAKEAASEGAYAVVAVGGDGSVRDVAIGLLGTKTALGIVPKGSGNGMARSLNIPLRVEQAISVINKGAILRIDTGYVNGNMFLSNAGVGFDALISQAFADSKRRGLAAYSWLVTKHLWQYREWEWDITIDGKPYKERAFLINIANGQQFGYNFKIAPLASFTDGWLDVTIIRKFPRLMGGSLVWRALKGIIHDSPYVKHVRAKEIIISHPELQIMQTDGDAHPCSNPLRFEVAAASLDVIAP